MRYLRSASIILLSAACLLGCAAAATSAAGMGGSAAITHTMNGITYRTFTAPQAKVRMATIRALERMQIKLISDSLQNNSNIRLVTAKSSERRIEIELEPISPNTTRMRVTAKGSGLFYDASTAEEVIQQTKLSLS
jgi:Protein of unknown function (DUF3568)